VRIRFRVASIVTYHDSCHLHAIGVRERAERARPIILSRPVSIVWCCRIPGARFRLQQSYEA
jgi:Fe-S oxidoreductase